MILFNIIKDITSGIDRNMIRIDPTKPNIGVHWVYTESIHCIQIKLFNNPNVSIKLNTHTTINNTIVCDRRIRKRLRELNIGEFISVINVITSIMRYYYLESVTDKQYIFSDHNGNKLYIY